MELDNHMSALERHIQKLREDLKKKELEIESVKEKIQALLPVKIYTRKELKLMADKQKKKEDQKINYEKSHIDLITLDAMREADKIRDEAGSSESEKRAAELKALTMEIQALEKDIKIKNEVIQEKHSKMEKHLAEKVISETKLKRLERKIKLNHNIPSPQLSEMKKEVFYLKNKISSLREKYFVMLRQVENTGIKVASSEKELILRKTKLKNLTY
ncbi:MAG: hypothetical protein Q4B93_02500 [Clostridia bacterium]|nr:hypothetical protein [Clostridia bacterium]